jgi:hypothetical protein
MSLAYDVFARKEYAEPLTYVGSVEVEEAAGVARACLDTYGPESEWLEMVAAPQTAVYRVFSKEQEASEADR